jgi:hypothetical protein
MKLECKLVKVSLIEFQHNLWGDLQDAWKIQFMECEFNGAPEGMAICPPLQTTLHYGSIWLKFRTSEQFLLRVFHIETIYGTCRKVLLWPYVNQALLWINVAENRDWQFFKSSILILKISG